MKKLILFDVDYTLIKGSKAHKLAIVEGIKEIYGVHAPIDRLELPGMTDQQIVMDLLKICGIEKSVIEKKMSLCIRAITSAYNRLRSQDSVELLEGVKPLLHKLHERNDVIMGLVTGNIEAIAYGKLSLVGIDKYFSVGGFGSDHIERYKLVEIAIERAKYRFNEDQIKPFVVGDTPKDIYAAKKANVTCIAVATGKYGKSELEEKGTDLVLNNLTEIDKFISFIDKTDSKT